MKKKNKIVDLSLLFHAGMQTYHRSYHPKFKRLKSATHRSNKREVSSIQIGSHLGTHVDAPRHFIKNGKTIDQFSVDHFCGEAIIVNLVKKKKKTLISIHDVEKQIKNFNGKIIIFRFDWTDKYYGKLNFYYDHPYLSASLCKWLVKKKIKLVGLDTPQPDNPENSFTKYKDGENHKILLRNDVLIIEYLTNLKKIKKKQFYLIAAPLNIQYCDGSPARCIGIY
jgi:arylformamidase